MRLESPGKMPPPGPASSSPASRRSQKTASSSPLLRRAVRLSTVTLRRSHGCRSGGRATIRVLTGPTGSVCSSLRRARRARALLEVCLGSMACQSLGTRSAYRRGETLNRGHRRTRRRRALRHLHTRASRTSLAMARLAARHGGLRWRPKRATRIPLRQASRMGPVRISIDSPGTRLRQALRTGPVRTSNGDGTHVIRSLRSTLSSHRTAGRLRSPTGTR